MHNTPRIANLVSKNKMFNVTEVYIGFSRSFGGIFYREDKAKSNIFTYYFM